MSAQNSIAIGVDIATAHVRAIAVNPDEPGALIGPVEVALPQPIRDGTAISQEPVYAEAVQQALAALAGVLGERAQRVGSLSITATSGTLVACDSAGVPIAPALMYNDERGSAHVAGAAARHASHVPHQSIGRLWWLSAHTAASLVLSPADVALATLAGRPVAADNSHHLKSAIDPVGLTWPGELLDDLGISSSLLPELTRAGGALGEITDAIADRCGLPRGVQLVAGMTDGCTSQISTGAIRPGDTVGVLGTTLVLKAASAQPVTDTSRGVYSHLSPDGLFLPGGASNVGVGSLRTIDGMSDDVALAHAVEAAAESAPSGALFYPLVGQGERFPFRSPDATKIRHGEAGDRAEQVRQVIEGVAFTERWGLETLAELGAASQAHHVSGGGSRSSGWNRLRASVLGRDIYLPRYTDSAIGAGLIALAHHSGQSLAATAEGLLPKPTTIEPEPAWVEVLEQRYRQWRDMLRDEGYGS